MPVEQGGNVVPHRSKVELRGRRQLANCICPLRKCAVSVPLQEIRKNRAVLACVGRHDHHQAETLVDSWLGLYFDSQVPLTHACEQQSLLMRQCPPRDWHEYPGCELVTPGLTLVVRELKHATSMSAEAARMKPREMDRITMAHAKWGPVARCLACGVTRRWSRGPWLCLVRPTGSAHAGRGRSGTGFEGGAAVATEGAALSELGWVSDSAEGRTTTCSPGAVVVARSGAGRSMAGGLAVAPGTARGTQVVTRATFGMGCPEAERRDRRTRYRYEGNGHAHRNLRRRLGGDDVGSLDGRRIDGRVRRAVVAQRLQPRPHVRFHEPTERCIAGQEADRHEHRAPNHQRGGATAPSGRVSPGELTHPDPAGTSREARWLAFDGIHARGPGGKLADLLQNQQIGVRHFSGTAEALFA